jgi:hypothetical protein
MVRLHFRPSISWPGVGAILLLVIPSVGATIDGAVYPAAILGALGGVLLGLALRSSAVAVGAIHCALIKLDFECS